MAKAEARPSFGALALAGLLALLPPALGGQGPESTEPWWQSTLLDRDRDGLDDALAGSQGRLRVLVSYAAPPSAEERAALEERGARVLWEARVIPVVVAEAPADALPRVARAPGVVLVEQDRPLRPLLDESRPLVRADAASESLGVTGRGVTIAVFDTGIDPNHPDFEGRVLAQRDASRPGPLSGLLGEQGPVVPSDTEGHGTHVAGIAAGPGRQSRERFVGVAPEASLINMKVFDATGNASSSYVLEGIDWALANKERFGIRVLQMSLGGAPTDGTDALSRAVNAATDRGLLTVAAAGNAGPEAETVGVPGVAERALTVGAVDKSLRIARFSSRGPTLDGREKPDIVAPGVDVTSTVPVATVGIGGTGLVRTNTGYYGALSGTSMAAPHVAGAAALVFEANASLGPDEAKAILVASSRTLGPNPGAWDPAYGWGFLDAELAVRAARDPSVLDEGRLGAQLPERTGQGILDEIAFQVERARRAIPAAPAGLALAAMLLAALLAGARRG